MNNRKAEGVVFETVATCTVLVAGTAFGALLYRVITVAASLLTSMAPQLLMVTGL